jgi:NAD(P)-dependent dehydrogenase (short-subunit alcohol dehydrogenase family)
MDEKRFDGRVAVITGAGRGLGRAYALLLAARGAKIVVNDTGDSRHGVATADAPANQVVDAIRTAGGEAVSCTASVASAEGGQAITGTALEHFGRIDILIHNAGINRPSPLLEMSWEQFSAVLGVHLHGAFHLVRAALPHMSKARYGRMVLTSSIAGLYGSKSLAAYAVAKAGLIGLSHAVALEGADYGVQCNAIVPAAITRLSDGIDTSSFPPTMIPDTVAPAVAWLVHESCQSTGEVYVALAGRIAKAYVTETRGAFRKSWTIEQVAEDFATVGDANDSQVFVPFPRGFHQHLEYSFAMARTDGDEFRNSTGGADLGTFRQPSY